MITAYLFYAGGDDDPELLKANEGKAFKGPEIGSLGFLVANDSPEFAELKNETDPRNASLGLLKPYVGGEDLNSHAVITAPRFIMDTDGLSEPQLKSYPRVASMIHARVRQDFIDRGELSDADPVWWNFRRPCSELRDCWSQLPRLLCIARVSQTAAFTYLPRGFIANEKVVVFRSDQPGFLSLLQSRCHEIWARFFSGTMKDDLQYALTDCFETFPFPENFETDPALEAAGKEYYEYRAALMVEHDEGLTKTYNRFHDPAESNEKILRLRELHAAMDRAVLDAYGWNDVPTACGFALDWLDLDDDELADTLASAPDDIRERIESADYVLPDAAAACRFQSHIKQSGKGKLPWRYRWPDEVRDDVLARLLALNAHRAELERLTGLPGGSSGGGGRGDSPEGPVADDGPDGAPSPPLPAKKAKKATNRAAKKSGSRPMFDDSPPNQDD